MKVFWSWQSDTPGKIGRFLLKDALLDAITELKEPPDIEEPTAEATREALHLDHDIKDLSGSPDLVSAILKKIAASDVVVADVTPVGKTFGINNGGKGETLINSNVAIELGYALHSISDSNVVLVFNKHYGAHEDLPFDLRHKGGAITFDLAPTADKKEIAAQQNVLRSRFVEALRPFLKKKAESAGPVNEMRSTFNKAAYFQKDELLCQFGTRGFDEIGFAYETEHLCYLRLGPARPLVQGLALSSLSIEAPMVPLLGGKTTSALHGLNQHGAIHIDALTIPAPPGRGKIKSSTQLFENGEIWSVNASLIVSSPNGRPADLKYPMLHCLSFEREYYDALHAIADFAANRLHVPLPWQVELGITGSYGIHLSREIDGLLDQLPMRKPEIVVRLTLNENGPSALSALLLKFFSTVHDSVGSVRPPDLFGFPPGRPHS